MSLALPYIVIAFATMASLVKQVLLVSEALQNHAELVNKHNCAVSLHSTVTSINLVLLSTFSKANPQKFVPLQA